MIYLDWAASAPIDETILADFNRSWVEDFANPSAVHRAAKDIMKKVVSSRSYFLNALNANSEDHAIFTSSATEANNTLIKGLELNAGDTVFYFSADHPSLVQPIERVAREKNLNLKEFSPLNDNWTDELDASVKLVLLTHVHGQNGLTLDLETLVKKVKALAPQAHIHVDAVQSFGKLALDVKKMQIDSLSLSSHKISGPKGVGLLYFKKSLALKPLLDGGGHEGGFRSSTLAAPLIFAFENAAKNKLAKMSANFEHVQTLKNQLRQLLTQDSISFPFHAENYSPFISCFLLEAIPTDVVMRHLEMDKIYVASSSACSSKVKAFNPTFEKLGIDKKFHKNVLRVSFGDKTTLEEIQLFATKLVAVISQLKGLKL